MKLGAPPLGCFSACIRCAASSGSRGWCQRVLRRRQIAGNRRMRMSTRKQIRGEPAPHEPADPLFDGASAQGSCRVGARSARVKHFENQQGREDPGALRFFPVKRAGICSRGEDRLFFGQCAANRLRRAQRSTAANQWADLAAVRARIQRRRQYLCRRAMRAGSCRQWAFRLGLIVISHSSALRGLDRRTGLRA
jgi:hypothetical protein